MLYLKHIECFLTRQGPISGFKTFPQTRFLCGTEGFNTRDFKNIRALESLGPP